jgi:hypothetical protein
MHTYEGPSSYFTFGTPGMAAITVVTFGHRAYTPSVSDSYSTGLPVCDNRYYIIVDYQRESILNGR